MKTMTIAENFAASQVLTEWPDNMNYDQLLQAVEDGHEDVIVWSPFENDLPLDIVDAIESQRVSFLRDVAAMTADLCQAIEQGDPMTIAERMIALRADLGA